MDRQTVEKGCFKHKNTDHKFFVIKIRFFFHPRKQQDASIWQAAKKLYKYGTYYWWERQTEDQKAEDLSIIEGPRERVGYRDVPRLKISYGRVEIV